MTLDEIADKLAAAIDDRLNESTNGWVANAVRPEILSALRAAAGITVADLPGMKVNDTLAEEFREQTAGDPSSYLDDAVNDLLVDRDHLLLLLRDQAELLRRMGEDEAYQLGREQAMAEVRPLLEQIEFGGWSEGHTGDSHPACPCCGVKRWKVARKEAAHKEDCQLAALLGKARKP